MAEKSEFPAHFSQSAKKLIFFSYEDHSVFKIGYHNTTFLFYHSKDKICLQCLELQDIVAVAKPPC